MPCCCSDLLLGLMIILLQRFYPSKKILRRLRTSKKRQPCISASHQISRIFLPPACVVRREGNVLTCVCPSIHQSVCPQGGGGYPYPIMLCNISQNAMGQTPGVPISHNALQHFPECHGADTGGGYPYPIMLCNITQNSMGQTTRGEGTQPGPAGGVPCQVRMGGTLLGGTLPGQDRGYPGRVPPRQGTPRARTGVPCPGGYPTWVPPAGYPPWARSG